MFKKRKNNNFLFVQLLIKLKKKINLAQTRVQYRSKDAFRATVRAWLLNFQIEKHAEKR